METMNFTFHTLGEEGKLLLHQNSTLIKEKETLVKTFNALEDAYKKQGNKHQEVRQNMLLKRYSINKR
jgi:hypothetical protein